MPQNTKIIAHRGAHLSHQENTIDAFEHALELGADGIEFDVRLTADEEFIVFHDASLDDTMIVNLTYQQIQGETPYEVPRLVDVLEHFHQRTLLDVEIKVSGHELELANMLSNFLDMERDVITSFDVNVLKRLKLINRKFRTGIIIAPFNDSSDIFELSLADIMVPGFRMLSNEHLLERMKDVPCWTWIVNSSINMDVCFKMPTINGIITDDVALCLERRDAMMATS